VAAFSIEQAARAHLLLETAWSGQLNELQQYKPEAGLTLLKKDWSSAYQLSLTRLASHPPNGPLYVRACWNR